MAGRQTKPEIEERQLHHWKLLEAFQQRLEPVLGKREKAATELDPRRRLQSSGYLLMMLFAFLNPVIKSTRALCAASGLQRMQEEVNGGPVSLGSFSAMQAVCEPELLAGLLREISAEALPVFGDERVRAQVRDLTANDGTLLPALPRMAWALWQDERHRAGKLHLEFSVWRQVPSEFTVTPGNSPLRIRTNYRLKPPPDAFPPDFQSI